MFPRFLSYLSVFFISCLAIEFGIRTTFGRFLGRFDGEQRFWVAHPALGWERRAHSSGWYTQKKFRAMVKNDSFGNRLNALTTTFQPNFDNLFFIGDSHVAALEVESDRTIVAVVEQGLRKNGHKVNVLNLGVRGYSTYQAVKRALLQFEVFHPKEIIYLFSANDFHDNNQISRGRKFNKPIYFRKSGEMKLIGEPAKVTTSPIPRFHGLKLNSFCEPIEYEWHSNHWYFQSQYNSLRSSLNWASKYAYTIRAFDNALTPYFAIPQFDKNEGERLKRCPQYYKDQIKQTLFLLKDLKPKTRLTVIIYPISNTQPYYRALASEIFFELKEEGFLDRVLDLSALFKEEDWEKFRCPGDGHFCEKGTQWIGEQILSQLYQVPQT